MKKRLRILGEKKTVQKILGDFLDLDITQNRTLEALAKKAGLSTDGSIKDLVTAVCVLNTLKKGDVSELEKIAKLLGEQTEFAAAVWACFLELCNFALFNNFNCHYLFSSFSILYYTIYFFMHLINLCLVSKQTSFKYTNSKC